MEWRKLVWLQGNLKVIKSNVLQELKNSLKTNNFIMPFNVAQLNGELLILDGHHRKKALDELEKEGEIIPDILPANFIKCKDVKEAKKLVLVYSSVYAKVNKSKYDEYVIDNAFDPSELEGLNIDFNFDLPDILKDNAIENKNVEDNEDNEDNSPPDKTYTQENYPLAITLTRQQNFDWEERKDKLKLRNDTTAFLRLLYG
ncbi:MAG: ParB N-terminal domain-containing protein [Patescibacteria group bacterium]